ncbi:DUF5082 domain-containing protein [Staphylococcus agnetis]|uniref:DUF5082 domain-containing protein n=1 Tax=Staphylococcus agnetis TaxID=985762 RepID=UPI0021D1DCF1|nr:DUF5082 domain-containing protein [Staphylococcus agnetis]UXU64125.1 DUF5082 domain-containing protein [Staphylococcus agnetis]UXU66466.1 DUF5082 domain-containing protein [Staphylococcus agnetis]
MGKSEIRELIATKKREAQIIENELTKLKREREELNRAYEKVKTHNETFSDTLNEYKGITIASSHWKGQTKTKSDEHLQNLTTSADDVKTKIEEARDALKSDVSKKDDEISDAESRLITTNSVISGLEALI